MNQKIARKWESFEVIQMKEHKTTLTLSNASPGASSSPFPMITKSSTPFTSANRLWPPLISNVRKGNFTLQTPIKYNIVHSLIHSFKNFKSATTQRHSRFQHGQKVQFYDDQ